MTDTFQELSSLCLPVTFTFTIASDAALTLLYVTVDVCEGFWAFVLWVFAQLQVHVRPKESLDLSLYLSIKTVACGLIYLKRKLNDLSIHPC